MCDCEVLNTSAQDGTSKTSEWLMSSNFSTDCGDRQQSSSSGESSRAVSPIEDSEPVKPEGSGTKLHSDHYHRKHRHSKFHKKKHVNSSGVAVDRFKRTATVLRCSGLLQITRSISQLLHNNEIIQSEIDKLQHETKEHSQQLQRQLQKKLEVERETRGACSPEGQKLLTKLAQFEWNWIIIGIRVLSKSYSLITLFQGCLFHFCMRRKKKGKQGMIILVNVTGVQLIRKSGDRIT